MLASKIEPHQYIAITDMLNEAESLASEIWGSLLGVEISKATLCSKTLIENWASIPYALTQGGEPDAFAIHATVSFLAVSLSCMTSLSFYKECIKQLPSFPDEDELVSLSMPKRFSAVSENILEIVIPSVNSSEFVIFSLLRYHLESRLEKLKEAYATVNKEFPLEAVKLQLLAHPHIWSEQRFTVDTPRIISLLMGSELYGEKSKNIWFREVYQNAVDACRSLKAVAPGTSPDLQIFLTYSTSDRFFSSRDTGIGMLRSHIDRYLCRIGRSIWRSEELKQKYADHGASVSISIGKFGIGFLSVFEVAEEVFIRTRHHTEKHGRELRITSPKDPFFVREDVPLPIGTEVVL